MIKIIEEIEKFPYPDFEHSFLVTQEDISSGEFIDPVKRLEIFSSEEFERFIQLWVKEHLKDKYKQIDKCGGAGDKGRDVLAYYEDGTWDNYQCKKYAKALSPSDIWIEIGKLCYYTYSGSYKLPKTYYFVCSNDLTPSLFDYLKSPEQLKLVFIEKWDKHCKNKITASTEILLTEEFRSYINKIDFSMFKHITTLELISSVKDSVGYSSMFGGGLKKRRDVPSQPPKNISVRELKYVRKILDAYGDYLKTPINNETEINDNMLYRHFNRQRRYYYTAETLLVLDRDIRVGNDDTVISIKDEIFDSIIDTVDSEFNNGFERLKETTDRARRCDLSGHPLLNVTNENDKHGICHHLANEGRLEWIKKDE